MLTRANSKERREGWNHGWLVATGRPRYLLASVGLEHFSHTPEQTVRSLNMSPPFKLNSSSKPFLNTKYILFR